MRRSNFGDWITECILKAQEFRTGRAGRIGIAEAHREKHFSARRLRRLKRIAGCPSFRAALR